MKTLKIWDRLDEVLGAAMLTTTALVAMIIGYDSSVAQMSITGVVALLAVKAVTPNEPGSTKRNHMRPDKSEERQNGK